MVGGEGRGKNQNILQTILQKRDTCIITFILHYGYKYRVFYEIALRAYLSYSPAEFASLVQSDWPASSANR